MQNAYATLVSLVAFAQDRLKNESRVTVAQTKGRGREIERIAKRFGALYRNLQLDDRAIEHGQRAGEPQHDRIGERVRRRSECGCRRR